MDDATFNTYWQDISNALVGLGADAAAINTLKTESMDSVIEKHHQELLREWKKDDDSSKDRLDEIKKEISKNPRKKSFCWPSNLSIDYVISTFVNMYVAFCDLLLVWKCVWILEASCENRCGK